MKPIRVLVTGAGSGVGQGIMKSLRISGLPITLIAADIHPLNAGIFRGDEAVLIPKVEESGALERTVELLKEQAVDVVLIGSEFDLNFFAENSETIKKTTGSLVIVSELETVRIADDKWLTTRFLEKNNLPFPRSFLPIDLKDCTRHAASLGYPCVLKSRFGTSNRNVHIIGCEKELEQLYPRTPKPLIQEMIAEPSNRLNSEYTCSVFKCNDGSLLGPFTARRTLRSGNSWHVEVRRYEDFIPLLSRIGELLPVMGSINVQLMMGKDGPVPFEFNARFSGTTAVRSYFGFNEPAMAIKNYFLGEKLSNPEIREGLALRYLEEVFIDDVSLEPDDLLRCKGRVMQWF